MSSTEEQKVVLNAILENNTYVYVTGPAGSGKTVLAVGRVRKLQKIKIKFYLLQPKLSRFLSQLLSDLPSIEVYSLFGFFPK